MTIDIGSILATVAILVVLAFGVVIMLATMDDRWSDFKKNNLCIVECYYCANSNVSYGINI